nr:hypothetical protein K-LCC10_0282 [Kaumoebavirus]
MITIHDTPTFPFYTGPPRFPSVTIPLTLEAFNGLNWPAPAIQKMVPRLIAISRDPRIMPWSWPKGDQYNYNFCDRTVTINGIPINYEAELYTPNPIFHKSSTFIYNYLASWIRKPKIAMVIRSVEVSSTADHFDIYFKDIEGESTREKFYLDFELYEGVPNCVAFKTDDDYVEIDLEENGDFNEAEMVKFLKNLDDELENQWFYKAIMYDKLKKKEAKNAAILRSVALHQGLSVRGKPNVRKIGLQLLEHAMYRPRSFGYRNAKRRFRNYEI